MDTLAVGFIATVYAFKGNWLRYRQFDSIINERDYDFDGSKQHNVPVQFPIITACSNSMHSVDKIQKHYAHLFHNLTLLKALYGAKQAAIQLHQV